MSASSPSMPERKGALAKVKMESAPTLQAYFDLLNDPETRSEIASRPCDDFTGLTSESKAAGRLNDLKITGVLSVEDVKAISGKVDIVVQEFKGVKIPEGKGLSEAKAKEGLVFKAIAVGNKDSGTPPAYLEIAKKIATAHIEGKPAHAVHMEVMESMRKRFVDVLSGIKSWSPSADATKIELLGLQDKSVFDYIKANVTPTQFKSIPIEQFPDLANAIRMRQAIDAMAESYKAHHKGKSSGSLEKLIKAAQDIPLLDEKGHVNKDQEQQLVRLVENHFKIWSKDILIGKRDVAGINANLSERHTGRIMLHFLSGYKEFFPLEDKALATELNTLKKGAYPELDMVLKSQIDSRRLAEHKAPPLMAPKDKSKEVDPHLAGILNRTTEELKPKAIEPPKVFGGTSVLFHKRKTGGSSSPPTPSTPKPRGSASD